MKQLTTLLLLSVFLFVCAYSSAQQISNQQFNQLVEGKQQAPVIVMLRRPANAEKQASKIGNGQWLTLGDYIEEAQQKLSKDMGWVNFNEIVKYKHVPAIAKSVSAEEFAELKKSSLVQAIFEDRFNQLSLSNSAQMIGQGQVAQYGTGGAGVSVAVIDSGMQVDHPFFQERVIGGACFSRYGSCPNKQKVAKGRMAGRACQGNEDCMHGTHVGGIVAGKDNQITGVAPQANLLSINVFSVVGNRIGALDSDIMQALEWVYEQHKKYNIAAINMSLGGGVHTQTCEDAPVKRLVDLLLENNVITVIASGNDGETNGVASPACVANAVTVGSLEPNGQVSSFSNSYHALDIVAPGGKIYSSVLNGHYAKSSGTSMAAPQVAGAIALLKSLFPTADAQGIIKALNQGPAYSDSRNSISTPSLYLPNAVAWLKQRFSGSQPKPSPKPTDPPSKNDKCAPKRIGGILVENTSRDCQKGGIQW